MKNPFVVEPYNTSQLADMYKVSRPTMRKWLKPILAKLGLMKGRLFNIKEVEFIVKHIGKPKRVSA